ncbi:MAG: ATP-binding protein, partial [Candidatus Eremiobacteraeota bacterium]|nr:ATP-binding protein [Candidatus Eremiobacteraeota bacterium]
VTDPEELFCNENNEDIEIVVECAPMELETLAVQTGSIPPFVPTQIRFRWSRATKVVTSAIQFGAGCLEGPLQLINGNVYRNPQNTEQALDCRSILAACDLVGDTLYVPAFRNLINVGANDSFYDILTGDAFVRRWSSAAGPGLRAGNEAVASLNESVEAVFRFGRFELLAATDQRSLQAYIDRRPYKLSELGTGLAQFIMVMFSASLRRPAFVLIDEPETGLHPSLQIDFLTTLADTARIGTLFATHSMGLARSVADKTYTVVRAAGRSELKDFDAQANLAEFLGEMSYSGSVELGYRKVLLVEGYTEIKTFQQFLRMLKIDHEVTIIPLGGSTVIRSRPERALVELRRLSHNIFALIDSERMSATVEADRSRKRFAKACARLGIDCHVLDRRSTENYFTEEAIRKTQLGVRPAEALGDYGEVPTGWSKELNWRTAREMSWDDVAATDLGVFLARLKDAPIR